MLTKIIDTEFESLTKPQADVVYATREVVAKMITRIDLFKLQGRTGGEAAEKFGDFLGFLRIPYTLVMQEFFARRWTEHVVWTRVPLDMPEYYTNQDSLFTVARLEPSTVETPFYKNGIQSLPSGDCRNPQDGGTVRKAAPTEEDFSNFIISQFVPQHFYIEVKNTDVEDVLTNCFPASDYTDPLRLYGDITQVRGTLMTDLVQQRGYTKLTHKDFTLIEIDSYAIELNNDYLYTKKLHAHKQGSRLNGYFYIGAISSKAISVSKENRTYTK